MSDRPTSTTTAAHGPGASPSFEIASLDGIRFVSILIVFVGHAGWGDIVPGGFGVTIFFFLSGYLITTLLRREFDRHRSISLRNFYLRRALRIWPAFYLVLFAGIALTLLGALPGDLGWRAVVAQCLHFANYDIIRFGNGDIVLGTEVYWSLAVEEHFYLLFPVLFVVLRRRLSSLPQISLVLLGLCAVILAWRLVLVVGLDAGEFRTYYASDTRFDSILFGCALALVSNPAVDRSPIADRTWWRWLLPAGLVIIAATLVIRDETFRETFRYTLQGVALVPVFFCAVRFAERWPFRLLNLAPMRYLGQLTYGLYLVHFTVILGLEHHLPDLGRPARALLAFGISVGLAAALHTAVERPLAPVRRRLARS